MYRATDKGGIEDDAALQEEGLAIIRPDMSFLRRQESIFEDAKDGPLPSQG